MHIINTTPHVIRFLNNDGTEFTVEPCGVVINAFVVEDSAVEYGFDDGLDPNNRLPQRYRNAVRNGVSLVTAEFVSTMDEDKKLKALEEQYPDGIIVGSIIAAQAFKGRVVAMTPAKGYERVPLDQKKMNPIKFTIYS